MLRLPRIGIHDNFFEMGGHSLLATRVVSRVAKDFRINVPLLEFFSKPTIAGLADSIKSHEPRPGAAEKIAKILNKVSRLSSDQIKSALEEKKATVLSAADF
jgi:acyl carrier protein